VRANELSARLAGCVQSEVEVDEHVHLLIASAVHLDDALELQYRRHWIAAISASARRPRISNRCGHSLCISRFMAASSRKASRRGG
jgi:hypothetical protein